MAKWKTSIAEVKNEKVNVRGYDLEKDLLGKVSFTEMIFLVLSGKKPTKEQKEMLDAIFVSATEHGITPQSVATARMAASGSGNFLQSLAAGILAMGEHHGGAVEGCAKLLQENDGKNAKEIVNDFIKNNKRIPGYGHKIYTDEDPRTTKLFEIAKKNKIYGKSCKLAQEIAKEIEKQKGKKLCLNIDGAIASIISDMEFDWQLARAFFAIPRTVGISAHVHEELTKEKPYSKKIDEEETEYTGKKV